MPIGMACLCLFSPLLLPCPPPYPFLLILLFLPPPLLSFLISFHGFACFSYLFPLLSPLPIFFCIPTCPLHAFLLPHFCTMPIYFICFPFTLCMCLHLPFTFLDLGRRDRAVGGREDMPSISRHGCSYACLCGVVL